MGIFNRLQAWGNWLTTDPVGFFLYILYYAAALLLTLMLHEIAHGYAAYRCGDPTAKMMGRLTLDPRKHLDLFGTISMVLVGIGWAKPVPINPRNFQGNRVRADFLVSIAGIVTNLTLFIVALLLATIINPLLWKPAVLNAVGGPELFLSQKYIGFYAIVEGPNSSFSQQLVALFGGAASQITDLMQNPWLMHVQRFLLIFSMMNLMIGVFNLIPIPPLDGFHVFNDLLLKGRLQMTPQFARGAWLVFLLLVFSGVLSKGLLYVTTAIQTGVLKLFLLVLGG